MTIFVAAVFYYFVNTYMVTEREYAVYSSIEEPTLPVISAIVDGKDINLMPAYRQELSNKIANDSITPIPEDRRLMLHIQCYETPALEMSYEIRSLDTEHFIERTTVEEFINEANGEITAVLPIQNMINRDTPYLLIFKMDMGEEIINFYTKIIWPSTDDIYQMINVATDFSEKSFDAEAFQDLAIYLESDPTADTSTFGTTNLGSGFSQITWGDTGMELLGNIHTKVKAYDGIMAAVEVSYFSQMGTEAGLNPDIFYNTDEFTLRMGSDRVYMMDFERQTNQIFNGSKHFFSGLRINLGITNEESLEAVKSESLRYLAFKSGRELWIYDQTGKEAINVFSFRSQEDTLRADNDDHDIKILSLNDEGILDFVVYGYINRGRHEGYNGIIYYRYNQESKTLSEIFFMPILNSFENLKAELDELCVVNGTGIFYFKQNEAVMAVDLNSLEIVNVVSNLTKDSYDISDDQTEIAWLDGAFYEPNRIRIMNIMNGNTQTIDGSSNEILSVVSFFDQDFIYGISKTGDEASTNGRIVALPMRKLRIMDPDMTLVMEYEKEGIFLDNIQIENDRIHVGQYRQDEETGEYTFLSRDTIVSTGSLSQEQNIIQTDNDEIKKRIYYINLDESIRTTRTLNVEAPANVSYQDSGIVEFSQTELSEEKKYFSYSRGRLKGISYHLRDAIELIYDEMGWVVDENSTIIYSRSDRASSHTVQDPLRSAEPIIISVSDSFEKDTNSQDGYIIMDAYGIELDRILYYVYKDCPVLAFLNENEYCLIYSYTGSGIGVYHPTFDMEAESNVNDESMLYEDATMYFDLFHNNFIVFIPDQAQA